ncbi:Hypothetical protein D9617_6g094630 [Elsinoe fawcettii]|nr:Hypothetical protein D9617_6g094630 [Elsinoe fawcettii]
MTKYTILLVLLGLCTSGQAYWLDVSCNNHVDWLKDQFEIAFDIAQGAVDSIRENHEAVSVLEGYLFPEYKIPQAKGSQWLLGRFNGEWPVQGYREGRGVLSMRTYRGISDGIVPSDDVKIYCDVERLVDTSRDKVTDMQYGGKMDRSWKTVCTEDNHRMWTKEVTLDDNGCEHGSTVQICPKYMEKMTKVTPSRNEDVSGWRSIMETINKGQKRWRNVGQRDIDVQDRFAATLLHELLHTAQAGSAKDVMVNVNAAREIPNQAYDWEGARKIAGRRYPQDHAPHNNVDSMNVFALALKWWKKGRKVDKNGRFATS